MIRTYRFLLVSIFVCMYATGVLNAAHPSAIGADTPLTSLYVGKVKRYVPVVLANSGKPRVDVTKNVLLLNGKKYAVILARTNSVADVDGDVSVVWVANPLFLTNSGFFAKFIRLARGRVVKLDPALYDVMRGRALSAVAKVPGLTHLDLSETSVTDSELTEYASTLHTLRYLDLQSCFAITDTGLIKTLPFLQKLHSLNLSGTQVTTEGIIAGVAHLEALQSLDLTFCSGITDRALVEGVAHLTRLSYLNLTGCDVSHNGFIRSASSLQALRTLTLIGCARIDKSTVRLIERALPNCDVVFVDMSF